MPCFRQPAREHGDRIASLSRLVALTALIAAPSFVLADTLILDYHDGDPWSPVYGVNQGNVVGNFFPGLVGGDVVVWRMWFYHGGYDYPESGVPFEIHVIRRSIMENGDEEFNVEAAFPYVTTCNSCWEEVNLGGIHVTGVYGDELQLGVFLRPLGGTVGVQTPRMWKDCCPNYEHAATTLIINFPLAQRAEDRSEYDFPIYNSDYGLGEFMIGAEVSGDVIVPVDEVSFSAIKSLY